MKKRSSIEACMGEPLRLPKRSLPIGKRDSFAGWGQKANTENVRALAQKHQCQYLSLEDGFIGYIGHPAKNGHAVSLVSDDTGIYYDARQASQLEALIKTEKQPEILARAERLIEKIRSHCITKYNCYQSTTLPADIAEKLSAVSGKKILLVDQVAGDLSVTGALATEDDFMAMAEQAQKNNPDATLVLRTHPDTRLGSKKGILARANLHNVLIISEACHPHALINAVDEVYTVSSQMGFEGLLLNKPVHCFGMPFYAGWGLTFDAKQCARRNKQVSLPALVAAALIEYPKYYNPISQQRCEVEEIVDLIAAQYSSQETLSAESQKIASKPYSTIYLVGFSLWKRAFIKSFCAHLADTLKFVSQPVLQPKAGEQNVVWGGKYPELENCIRIEDGFIRSSGLGSNLCRPSSLAIDSHGIYFDSRKPSDLEIHLNTFAFEQDHNRRGENLITLLQQTGVSKYNVGIKQTYQPASNSKRKLLVVGQVDGDASIKTGSPKLQSNEALLWVVREKNPDAHIIYKPHPDVVAGNRGGQISADCRQQCVDEQVVELSLNSLYAHIDELHTMTSLSGFEALVQGVPVVTWGQPFYSGWGLTTDQCPPARRRRKVSLSELVYATLVLYPRYIDWSTDLFSTPELVISTMAQQGSSAITADNYWQRLVIKSRYLWQTFF
ncbi:capsular polysaccharide biosynthesis protein [Thalassotalea mangrovi]|uniref:Capsular polysaccharide biosynthesis protein n=2 Tax=Thalassotalea mangrovi TaxID=2572245 RepID=A0A4U1B8C3_9GAMM|nr:capsular polysaccharide biosynthesis protein [Thalassotalea mangrovi]